MHADVVAVRVLARVVAFVRIEFYCDAIADTAIAQMRTTQSKRIFTISLLSFSEQKEVESSNKRNIRSQKQNHPPQAEEFGIQNELGTFDR